jgi:hypothetical protein
MDLGYNMIGIKKVIDISKLKILNTSPKQELTLSIQYQEMYFL